MIKACIFDLDGVIVDTAKYHFKAWRRMANELGFDFSHKENEKLKGVSRMESLELILKWGGVSKTVEEKTALAILKNDWYVELIADMNESEVLEGVFPFLEDLKRNNIPFSLGSASKNAPRILTAVGLTQDFVAIIDGTKTTKSKPDPQVFQMGAAAMNVAPNETIVFEDAPKGVEAALNGGFYAVGIGEEESLGKAHFVTPNLVGIGFEDLQSKILS